MDESKGTEVLDEREKAREEQVVHKGLNVSTRYLKQ